MLMANGLLLGLLPWGLGVGMLYALLYQPKQWHPGHHLIVIGLGSYIGYMLLALSMYQLQARNLPVFSSWLITWGIAGVTICWVLGQVGRHRYKLIPQDKSFPQRGLNATEPTWLLSILAGWLILQLGFVSYEVAFRPAVSWDSMSYWTRYTSNFLQWQHSDPVRGDSTLGWRHPSTIHLLNVWAAYTGQISAGSVFLYVPWLALYAGIVLSATGCAWVLTGKLAFGFISGILLSSSSLITAHISLAGYADIWMAAGLFFSAAALVLAGASWRPMITVMWIFIAFSLTFIKAAGASYTILLICVALGACCVCRLQLQWLIATIVAASLAAGYFFITGVDASIMGYQLTFEPTNSIIRVGHYTGVVDLTKLGPAAANMWFAYFRNASYLLTVFIIGIALTSTVLHYNFWRHFNPAYTVFLTLGLLLHSIMAQSFSDYFLTHSNPDMDTGLTRFSQGWFLVSLLALNYIIKARSLISAGNLPDN